MKIENVIGDYNLFLDKIFFNLQKTNIGLNEFQELDHIAYRVESDSRYDELKKIINDNFAAKVSEVMFGGRRISVFRLKKPLEYKNIKINGFELLAPKENNTFAEGLEHTEFVLNISLKDFYHKYKDRVVFNLSAFDWEINPELIIEFSGCAVKFHNQSLLEVRGLN